MADPVAVIVPHETVNDETVKLLRFLVKDGDVVAKGQIIAEIETSKAVLELAAEASGIVRLVTAVGQEVPIGSPLCYIVESLDVAIPNGSRPHVEPARPVAAAPGAERAKAAARRAAQAPLADDSGREPAVKFTPLARKMAEEARLELTDFRGIRIVRSVDVKARRDGLPLPSRIGLVEPVHRDESAGDSTTPILAGGVEVRWTDLPRRKQVEIRQIAAGMRRVLPSSVVVAVPTSGLRAAVASYPVPGLTSSSVIVYETARLLRKHPVFNAIYSDGRIGHYESVNIGIAMDDGSGLMVPVIRDADRKTMPEIAAEARTLLERYVERKLGVQDFVGATFTISDLSGEGVFSFMPLISQGQSAILGVGSEFFPPGSTSGMFNLTVQFDHQLTDGRMASAFLGDLARRLAAYEDARGPASASAQRYCVSCSRDADAIRKLRGFLVRSEEPAGFVCSMCLGGF